MLLESLTQNLAAQEKHKRQSIIWLQGHSSGIQQSGIWSLPGFHSFIAKYFKVIPVDITGLQTFANEFSSQDTPHLLILDGYFSQDNDDSINNLLKDLIVVSRAVILLGNEASYGSNRPDGFMDLETELLHLVETPYFKLPGNPVPARNLLGALDHLILHGIPDLDEYKRPTMFYSTVICDRCDYRGDFESGYFVDHFGQREGCLYLLGCKGPVTKNSCAVEKWNETSNWCVGVGSPCTGCSEPGYPFHQGLGLYGQLSSNTAAVNSFFVRNSVTIAQGALAVSVAGVALHTISRKQQPVLENRTLKTLEDKKR